MWTTFSRFFFFPFVKLNFFWKAEYHVRIAEQYTQETKEQIGANSPSPRYLPEVVCQETKTQSTLGTQRLGMGMITAGTMAAGTNWSSL